MSMSKIELVDHPFHYNVGTIEVIEFIESWGMDYSQGNVVKYLMRHQYKGNPKQDLDKALWYLVRSYKKPSRFQKVFKRLIEILPNRNIGINGIPVTEFLKDWGVAEGSHQYLFLQAFMRMFVVESFGDFDFDIMMRHLNKMLEDCNETGT